MKSNQYEIELLKLKEQGKIFLSNSSAGICMQINNRRDFMHWFDNYKQAYKHYKNSAPCLK